MNTNDFYNDQAPSRVRKNENLYKRIDTDDIDSLSVGSNSVVLEGSTNTIDVNKLKSMLDKKYREPEKTKFKEKIEKPLVNHEVNLEETREYNLDDIINKARESSDYDYELERLKKLSDTNMSILDGLDIASKPSKVSSEPEKLVKLIDTINLKEEEEYQNLVDEDDDPLEMLSELKGEDEETKVMPASCIDTGKDKVSSVSLEEVTDEFDTTQVVDIDEDTTLSNSTELTTTQIFTKDDFDDFDDLKEAAKPKIFVKILIFLVLVLVIVGTVFVLNRFLDLGLF